MKIGNIQHLAGQIVKAFWSVVGCQTPLLSLQSGITAKSLTDRAVGDSLLSILLQKLTSFMALKDTSV